ncbi:MAG TPA: DotU family type IV/VI secretion system protein [Gemmatimonadaceae bacterium]|jgi:type VI secretion system protein ImpK|nr:DotU family type IV/VI secretion system protein [Gemmatimonadaceae bacterium]
MTAVATERPRGGSDASRRGLLALSLQEPFTTIARLRANRQVAADSESFRTRIKQVLSAAEQEARQAGYAADDIRLALFAVIAFLDETVLNSGQAMFADWPRRPLQQEVFGVHMAGELFFQYLQQLLGRQDSEDLADVLEVYELCLLLGFKGRYSASHGAELQVLAGQISEKIDRVHGGLGELSPQWRPSSTEIGRPRDVWVPRLIATATAAGIIAVVLYIGFAISLHSGKSDLAAVTTQLVR